MVSLHMLGVFLNYVAVARSAMLYHTFAEMLKRPVQLKVEFCQGLGYTMTSKINFLRQVNQSTVQQDCYFKALKLLSLSGCSELARLFTCAAYAPRFMEPRGAIPPCQSLCRRAEQQCQGVSALMERLMLKGKCRKTRKGEDYRGTLNKTSSGIPCQAWGSQTPHPHPMNPSTHPQDDLTSNYCRNPNGDPNGPWCYTTSSKKKYEYCDVPICKAQFRCERFPLPSKKYVCVDYKYNNNLGKMEIMLAGNIHAQFNDYIF